MPQEIFTVTQAHIGSGYRSSAGKTYIRAAAYPQPAFDQALAECKADKSWRTFEATNSGHDVMVDAPEWLVDVLVQVS
jgi:hypothetical protein